MTADLTGAGGELRFTVEIKRAATGKVETFDLIGKVNDNGSNTFDGGTERRN